MLGGKLVDTSNSDNKSNLGLGFDKEVSGLLGVTLGSDKCLISSSVLVGVLLCVLVSDGSLFSALFLGGITVGFVSSEELGGSSGLLKNILGDNSCPKTHQQMS